MWCGSRTGMGPSIRRWPLIAAAAALLLSSSLSSCAVGPDFKVPAAPDTDRYTREPVGGTGGTDVPQGQAQHFSSSRDIPAEWWTLFRSRPLDSLIRKSLEANPNLQSTLASLRAAREAVAAQQGKFFPLL